MFVTAVAAHSSCEHLTAVLSTRSAFEVKLSFTHSTPNAGEIHLLTTALLSTRDDSLDVQKQAAFMKLGWTFAGID